MRICTLLHFDFFLTRTEMINSESEVIHCEHNIYLFLYNACLSEKNILISRSYNLRRVFCFPRAPHTTTKKMMKSCYARDTYGIRSYIACPSNHIHISSRSFRGLILIQLFIRNATVIRTWFASQ